MQMPKVPSLVHNQYKEFCHNEILSIDDFISIYFITSNVSNTIFISVNKLFDLHYNKIVTCMIITRNTTYTIHGFRNQKQFQY